jgi:branched-subunit amino acid transport protein AzlD
MLSIVAAGFAVNFTLRALPFIFFSGKSRQPPKWAENFGNIISPIIIGALIVYSYSALEWRSPGPYLAGIVTVVLQLWRRNPLASIIAGTAIYMALLSCGCSSTPDLTYDAQNPAVRVSPTAVYFGDRPVRLEDVPKHLDSYGVPRETTIHIKLDHDVRNLQRARILMALLSRAGYTRPVLVTSRHAESVNLGKKKKNAPSASVKKNAEKTRKIRYKRASDAGGW